MLRIKKISEFNIGDKVMVIGVLPEYESYVPELSDFIGKEGEIVSLLNRSFKLKFDNGREWWYPRLSVSDINDTEPLKSYMIKNRQKVLVGKELDRTYFKTSLYNKIGVLTGKRYFQQGNHYAELFINNDLYYLPIYALFIYEPIYESKKIIRTLDGY